MATQQAALNRVAKRLTALRSTMRKEERAILDQIVLGSAQEEVMAHSMFDTRLALQAAQYVSAAQAANAAQAAQ